MVVILLVSPVTTSNCNHEKIRDRNNNINSSFCNFQPQTYKVPKEQYYVRHITKINISDANSQVEHNPDDAQLQGATKNEEWIKKKKTELTTTRQIETRVKRQVILEDGKVVDDSGPIVFTNTTEDTEKQESQTTERRDLGENETAALEVIENTKTLLGHTVPSGGVVREVKEKKIVSREEKEELLETEDVQHLGDFSDEVYIGAIYNNSVDNIKDALYSPESRQQLLHVGSRVVHQSTKSHKVVDKEDTDLQSRAQPDGTLVTEKKRITEHEEIFDEDVPAEADDRQSTGSQEKVTTKESSQRVYKSRDEQAIEDIVDGKVVGKEMKYVAETQDIQKDGRAEDLGDWDSLSDRIRKARRRGKTLLQQHREAVLDSERKDALTKRPLDFDQEEETRKLETSKWLESHFGSDSSRDSRNSDDNIDNFQVEPTKRTFFNVTIKSNPDANPPSHPSPQTATENIPTKNIYKPISHKLKAPSPPNPSSPTDRSNYFQGISNWTERKDSPSSRVFSGHAFREELKGTVDKRTRQAVVGSIERLHDESANPFVKQINTYRSCEKDDDIVYVVSPKNTYHYRRQSPERPVEYVYRENGGYHREIRPMFNGNSYHLQEEEAEQMLEEPHPVPPQRKRALERKMKMMYQNDDIDESLVKSQNRSVSPVNKSLKDRVNKSTPPIRASSPAQKNKVSTAIGNSLRKLVGKIAERKAKLKTKRSMSPPQQPQQQQQHQHRGDHTNGEYQQYDEYIDSHIEESAPHIVHRSAVGDIRRDRVLEQRDSSDFPTHQYSHFVSAMTTNPKQRFYLGEDPYGNSIYGRENKYDFFMQRPVERRLSYRIEPESDVYQNNRIYTPYQTHASTLGRLSASTNQLRSPSYTTSSQTLPRKLEHRPAHSSTINVSIVNAMAPTQNTGPAKPARSYKALNRSKSLNVHTVSDTNGINNKSNTALNLKSPSIVSMISRSQRDLRPLGATREVESKKSLFLRGLQAQAPELYHTLYGDNEMSPNHSTNYSRFSVEKTPRSGDLRTCSPVTINKDTASIVRRGSSSTDDYAETFNYTTRNDDPRKPSVTNTTRKFSKKTVPGKGLVESSETKSVTTSRYVPDLHNSHLLNRHVIEVKGNSPRH
ncbi:zinc finger CCCH domain-containing protein 13 isoform X1 [Sergentomyia squamirostris]